MKAFPVFRLLTLYVLSFSGFNSIAQPSGFTKIPAFGGGSGSVACAQDPQGYMWFGGIGIHRYDGYSFKSYYNNPSNPNSLVFDRIEAICAARNGKIWVGTNRMGLDCLDPETGIFTHYNYKPADSNSISNDTISAIIEDRDGKIWVGTEMAGLNCIDPETGIIKRYKHDPKDQNSLSFDKVTALFEDAKGTIWVGTGYLWHMGLKKYNLGGLNRYNRKENNFTRYLHKINDSSSLVDNRIRSIYEDSKGRMWVGTIGDGLHTFDRETGRFTRHPYHSSKPNGLSRPPVRNSEAWADDMISFIQEDASGALWIGTFSGGMNRYDPQTGLINFYRSLNDSHKEKNEFTNFWWTKTSKDGMLWIGTYDGIYRYDPLHKQIPRYDIGATVKSVLKDTAGNVWVGTTSGLLQLDSSRKIRKWILGKPSDSLGKYVSAIIQGRDGTIWIGTDLGLNNYDPQSGKFIHFPVNYHTTVVYETRTGMIWLGTPYGLASMDKKSGRFTFFRQTDGGTGHLSQNFINCILEDAAGYLWVGTEEGGLNRFDPRNKKFQYYLNRTLIQSIYQDSGDTIWAGTNKGIYFFNTANNNFELYTNREAGINANIAVYHILEDDHYALWLNTDIGLLKLLRNRNEVIHFDYKDGIIPPNWAIQGSCNKGKDGELIFGNNMSNSIYALYPEQLLVNNKPPILNITSFRIGDNLVDTFKQTNDIRLTYKQNTFSFDFAGIHFSSPVDNRHLFMLENLENQWRKSGEEKTAYYNNVPPGKYTFRVKAASRDGIWTERSIQVFISPPWWRTWWAYCFYGILFLAGIYIIHRFQKNRVIAAEREKNRVKELAQAKQIEQAYHELQSTQAQLIQREKMASLGELTAGIAHEIQNPLNFVNNFSEVNRELIDELKTEMDKGNLDEAKAIATDIGDNEEKINHHGKRADSIVKGMLQHSRETSSKKEPTDLNKLADEYLRLSYHGFRAKDKSFNATLKTDYDETIGNIKIIPQDIGRVILNLINNAFYAVDEKKKQQQNGYEPTVSITTLKSNGNVVISVKDNGNGIPQKVLDKIFQPFFTTKPTGQGTGLGLSLSYDIVKAHGGEIKVETREGEGTEFKIQIPLA